MRALAVLVLAPLLAFGVVGAGSLVNEAPAERWQTNLVWGDRVFVNPAQFERWLEGQGKSYAEWAKLHPAAVARLEGRPYAPDRERAGADGDRSRSALAVLLVGVAAGLALAAPAVRTTLGAHVRRTRTFRRRAPSLS